MFTASSIKENGIGPKEIVMMHIGNMPDVEQTITDAKYARMKFVRKNLRFFVYNGFGSRKRKSLPAGDAN